MNFILTTTVLLLGHSIPIAYSHGIFKTSLGEFGFLSADIRVTDVVDPRLLSRRAEQTISQQCVDDQKDFNLTDKYDEYAVVAESLRQSCPDSGVLLNKTDDTMDVKMDMTACDTSELRAFCDENFQTLELRPMVATCATKLPSNITGELEPMIVIIYSYDIIDCVPKSCPLNAADWSIEDIEISIGLSNGANCTVELMEGKGAEKESAAPMDPTLAPMDPAPSSASKLQLSWMFTIFLSVAVRYQT